MKKSKTGKELRDQGIKASKINANNKIPGWSQMAYKFLLKYSKQCKKFLAEDVRNAADGIVPDPPSARAWGAIFVRAKKAGLIKRIGYQQVKNPKAHSTPATLWQVV